MPSPADAPAPDIFTAARRMFHDLRGQITVIVNAVDLARTEAAHPLSDDQEVEMARILAATDEILRTITAYRTPLLDALALGDAAVSQVVVRRGGSVLRAALARHLAALRAARPAQPIISVIVVAAADRLPALRAAFRAAGCQVQVTTQPADIPYLLDAHSADLIAMAPPADATLSWWRTLRMLLPARHEQVQLLHLAELPPR